jgi:hypothetical protein
MLQPFHSTAALRLAPETYRLSTFRRFAVLYSNGATKTRCLRGNAAIVLHGYMQRKGFRVEPEPFYIFRRLIGMDRIGPAHVFQPRFCDFGV